ncbi:MAG: DHA2 family efflux MFS transporter permease subunit [Actinomycetia bacterium]|nr:DHA2 family efflux MFS transporter permease subunit [Actinomycetes bacterium]
MTEERLDRTTLTLLGIMVFAAFTLILNETLLGVALPELMESLAIPATTAQWLTSSFMLTLAVVTPTAGWVLARWSPRVVFVTAMSIFTAGTALAAAAPSFTPLLGGRILQASGTAIMIPLLMTTILRALPANRRGRMMGFVGLAISVAPAMGPSVSGLILQYASWRWLFILVLPIAVLTLFVGARLAPKEIHASTGHLDALSIVLSTVGFGALVLGLSSLGEETPLPVHPVVLLAIGALGVAWFVQRQRVLARSERAFLDLRTFRTPAYRIAVVLTGITLASLLGVAVILPLFTVNTLGMTPLATGLLLLPGALVMGAMGPIVGGLSDRHGARPLVLPGVVVFAGAMWLMTTFGPGTRGWLIVLAHVLMSVGISLINTPMMNVGLGSLPQALYSHGSAALTTFQQVAGGAATAAFVALLTIEVRWAFVAAAVLSLAAVGVALRLPRTGR